MENKEEFQFTYSAQQRQEVEDIRKKYLPQEESKLDQLRRLHASAGSKAKAWAITLGVVGTLLLGAGMSLFMTDLGASLGILAFIIGIILGLVGIGLVLLAYPLYNRILQKQRQRIAPLILQLTDELLQQ